MSSGVRTLDCIRRRCRECDETGCWIWLGACSMRGQYTPMPNVHIPPGVFGDKRMQTAAPRAAWLLAGKKLSKGQVVYRDHCLNSLCCNPDHGRAGTLGEMHARYAASGKHKGRPERRAVNLRNRMSLVTPVERVREVEAMHAQGLSQKTIVEATGLDSTTVRMIQRGRHPHSAAGCGAVRGSSVFAWRPAA